MMLQKQVQILSKYLLAKFSRTTKLMKISITMRNLLLPTFILLTIINYPPDISLGLCCFLLKQIELCYDLMIDFIFMSYICLEYELLYTICK